MDEIESILGYVWKNYKKYSGSKGLRYPHHSSLVSTLSQLTFFDLQSN